MIRIYVLAERNMIIAENFIRSLVSEYEKNTIDTDGGEWYKETSMVIGLTHYLYSPFQKNLM
ncbi:MAG: hypothetical protein MRJ93_12235 [Nitrososphaeraceae archaeon]|nr:hypothetical protein [Nitrososphaeraceae archaeon]